MKLKFLKILILLVLAEGSVFAGVYMYNLKNSEPNSEPNPEVVVQKVLKIQRESPKQSAILDVPFICQAPLQTEENWKLHEASCEEAAVLQAYLYETNSQMTKPQANEEILKMIGWEIQAFGEHKDLYADDLKKFIVGYYKIDPSKISIIYNASLEDIKQNIREGHPVIVPIMGETLKNPYYPYPGYHVLVVTGFTKDTVITNDNGTRRGENYEYKNDIFLKAMNEAGGDIVIIKTKSF